MKDNNKNKTKVPNLRFTSYNGSWVLKRLGNVAHKVNSGKTPLGGEATYTSEGVLFIRSQNINNNRLELMNSVFISEEINNRMLNSIVQSNDILLNITGASLGRSCVVPENFTIGNVNQHVCIIRLNEGYSPRFIQPILSSHKGQNIFLSLQTGSGREGLNFENIKNIHFFSPTIEEQKKIASFLSTIDTRIQCQSKIIEGLKSFKSAMSKRIFSQEFRFKCENGEKFAEWEKTMLGKLCKITTGKLDANAMVEDGEYRFYTCAKDYYQIDKYAFDTEALLISGNGANVGYIHYYNGKFNAYQRTYVLDGFKENIIFIKYFLQQFLSIRINAEKKEGNTPYIVLSALSEMYIYIPSLPEQTKIANFLSGIDEKIDLETSLLQQLKLQKQYLLQQMFI